MIHPLVVGVPDIGGVLLTGGSVIAVVHVEDGVGGCGEAGNLHPGHQLSCAAGVLLDLVAQLGSAVRRGEKDVVAIGLGAGRQAGVGGKVDEDWEICVWATADLGDVYGDGFP